jgi:predicted RNA-binding Zn-ribbon protein involved in translation (DUF1610 family)
MPASHSERVREIVLDLAAKGHQVITPDSIYVVDPTLGHNQTAVTQDLVLLCLETPPILRMTARLLCPGCGEVVPTGDVDPSELLGKANECSCGFDEPIEPAHIGIRFKVTPEGFALAQREARAKKVWAAG